MGLDFHQSSYPILTLHFPQSKRHLISFQPQGARHAVPAAGFARDGFPQLEQQECKLQKRDRRL
uniref:Uncharacterized protein n=1 Tax=Arundo donax TaxID=35708 RepID=A0A0A8ZTH5_ARUDO